MNSCNFVGRLTKEPEGKTTANGKVFCNFSIAVDRYKDSQGNRVVDFIPCTAWESTANLVTKYFHKGDLIGLSGRFESRQYEDNGVKKTAYSILVMAIDFIQGKAENKADAQPQAPKVEAPKVEAPSVDPNQVNIEDLEDAYPPFEI